MVPGVGQCYSPVAFIERSKNFTAEEPHFPVVKNQETWWWWWGKARETFELLTSITAFVRVPYGPDNELQRMASLLYCSVHFLKNMMGKNKNLLLGIL